MPYHHPLPSHRMRASVRPAPVDWARVLRLAIVGAGLVIVRACIG